MEYYLEDMFLLDINIKKLSYIGKGYPNSGICSSCERDKNGNIKDNTDCSTKGVQQCTYSVYQTWSNAKIVYESLTGGAQEVIKDCILKNCIGW